MSLFFSFFLLPAAKVIIKNENENENENFFRMGTKKSGRKPSGLLFDNG